jgi:hypothetical protein
LPVPVLQIGQFIQGSGRAKENFCHVPSRRDCRNWFTAVDIAAIFDEENCMDGPEISGTRDGSGGFDD